MAIAKDVVEGVSEVLRKAWVLKSLELQKGALMRSRSKEIVGSEIYSLRTREIQQLEQIMEEFR